MRAPTSHSYLEDLLGAHALDALDQDEAGTIEGHLQHCPRCRAELVGHREAVAVLGYAGGPAPNGVWDRIAASLEEAPPALRLGRIDPQTAPLPPAARSNATRPKLRRLPALMIAVLAVAAVTVGALAIQAIRLEDRTNKLLPSKTASAIQTAALTAAAREDARHRTLRSADGKLAVETAILPDGTGFVLNSNLPYLPPSETYQLWGVVGVDRISLGLLGAQPQVSMFRAETGVTGLAVTEGRAGGEVTSNKTPIVLAWFASATPG